VQLLPAIDIRAGRCVRLVQGDYERETVYGEDPVAQAWDLEAAGAPMIHVVDLDAAKTGEPTNRPIIAAIAQAVSVPVQTGGGIRDEAAAEDLFGIGVARVVLGTAAVEDPDLVRRLAGRHPGAVVVGLDARRGEVAVRGWTEGGRGGLLDAVRGFSDSGIAAFVVTDIGRDGMLQGPDVEGLTEVVRATNVDVIASGGIAAVTDLTSLAAIEVEGRRLAGAIVGTALYEGRFTVAQALAALSPGRGGLQ
jgi:phosphoribosylformimino-5-aminoimidazole carboxamide ribotide isomerase